MTETVAEQTSEERSLSFFEFWPGWVMYLPVVFLWLWQSLLSRSFTVSLLANPRLPLGGMVGVPKSLVLGQMESGSIETVKRDAAKAASPHNHDSVTVLPWCVFRKTEEPIQGVRDLERSPAELITTKAPFKISDPLNSLLAEHGLAYPLVFKPDCGCRGAGVKLIRDLNDALAYLERFPAGNDIFIQQLASYEPEAGIFYVREPDAERGHMVSLTLKHMPVVVGDGVSTLAELVARDARAGQKPALYAQRLSARWGEIIPAGERISLVFSASHCRGAVFRDARELITPALEARIDELIKQLPEFYYGRLDVKFANVDALTRGETIEVIEINGASAEQIHIWDSRTRFRDAIGSLLWQYRTLYRLGKYQRRQGYKPPGLVALVRAWRREKAVTRLFPVTD